MDRVARGWGYAVGIWLLWLSSGLFTTLIDDALWLRLIIIRHQAVFLFVRLGMWAGPIRVLGFCSVVVGH